MRLKSTMLPREREPFPRTLVWSGEAIPRQGQDLNAQQHSRTLQWREIGVQKPNLTSLVSISATDITSESYQNGVGFESTPPAPLESPDSRPRPPSLQSPYRSSDSIDGGAQPEEEEEAVSCGPQDATVPPGPSENTRPVGAEWWRL